MGLAGFRCGREGRYQDGSPGYGGWRRFGGTASSEPDEQEQGQQEEAGSMVSTMHHYCLRHRMPPILCKSRELSTQENALEPGGGTAP